MNHDGPDPRNVARGEGFYASQEVVDKREARETPGEKVTENLSLEVQG
jgi:hypothetical protein